MTTPRTHHTEHRLEVAAPARAVYELIVGVTEWPRIFPPSIHVERLDGSENEERIRVWATANNTVKTWTSRRELDAAGLRVRFRQEVSQPPVHGMGGEWIIEERPGGCLVRLLHDFRAVGDDPENTAWITRAVDRNSDAELAALRATAERGAGGDDELLLVFDDEVPVSADPGEVYAFIRDGGQWDLRLPHVTRVVLEEPAPDIQLLEMDTRTKDGSVHTTRSVRVCFPTERIVYKQLQPPALMSAHTGRWTFRPSATGSGGVVASRHTVVINPAKVTGVLGAGATVADARRFVRDALSANSTATIRAADTFAGGREQAVPSRG
ncbi:aromatase/cyclase [Streptomyces sp. ST2-7A]|uniref:aromatase/cyclase n=1 Tax=Streptomyces sp. ST2-7A TaxID=2907214 RepID=UPI001F4825BE|nr:aromatase/cyclase [Streptomyces sp. ST2-7A]MCE7081088.1 aromatase/cyclase [Streptomyces sp. ST2-7A]